ncbi:MAG: hypothetical protein RLZZ395_910, partial [Pseudomonadota bacterium]
MFVHNSPWLDALVQWLGHGLLDFSGWQ